MIESSLSTTSFFGKLPVETLHLIAGYLVPKPYTQSNALVNVVNLFKAYPSTFPFLKCFKDLSDAGMVTFYPDINLSSHSPPMTTELLESLIQSEPQKLSILSKKYLSTALFTQYRKRTKVELWLGSVSLTSDDMTQIVLALQSMNNNIIYVNLSNSRINVNDFVLLAKALEHKNNRVESLIFDFINIPFEGTKALANALVHPYCQLSYLSLHSNWLEMDGDELLMNTIATVRETREFRYMSNK
jgi:hypothetical protein